MKIKIGETWHDVLPEQPVMIAFDVGEREIISHNLQNPRRLAWFHSDDMERKSLGAKDDWMRAALRCPKCNEVVEDGHYCGEDEEQADG